MSLPFALSIGVMICVSMLVMSFFYNCLDARAASWNRLARFYGTEMEPGPNDIVYSTFAMNNRCYRRIATVGASRKGLYLALDRSHQFLHPPLLIPWSELEPMSTQNNADCALWIKTTATKLRMEDAAMREIQRFMPGDGPHLAPLAA